MQHMIHYFIIPGYQGSGPDHWQTWIEGKESTFIRIKQKDWNKPNLNDWAEQIDKSIEGYDPQSIVFVSHSLGCHAVAEWYKRYNRTIKAALLVAPPAADKANQNIAEGLIKYDSFIHFPFRTTLVASSNDPWISVEKAQEYAHNWGSEFINIGDAGHINNLSGYGEWEQGFEILQKLSH